MIAFNNMIGDSLEEIPLPMVNPDKSWVVTIGGDLRKIEVIKKFWQVAIELLDNAPHALWINFTTVSSADTKLAACVVAILRRAHEQDVPVYIIGSHCVNEVFDLCKFPPLKEFTQIQKAA